MQAAMVPVFHDTINHCFDTTLEGMGGPLRNAVYMTLGKKGINPSSISLQFDDVVNVLMATFGASARIIVYKFMTELYNEYSLRPDFSYQDSLRERLSLLKDRVVSDHLYPRRYWRSGPIATPSSPLRL